MGEGRKVIQNKGEGGERLGRRDEEEEKVGEVTQIIPGVPSMHYYFHMTAVFFKT